MNSLRAVPVAAGVVGALALAACGSQPQPGDGTGDLGTDFGSEPTREVQDR